LSIVQAPFSVAPWQTLISRFATFASPYPASGAPGGAGERAQGEVGDTAKPDVLWGDDARQCCGQGEPARAMAAGERALAVGLRLAGLR
jgi:hypothetical protein